MIPPPSKKYRPAPATIQKLSQGIISMHDPAEQSSFIKADLLAAASDCLPRQLSFQREILAAKSMPKETTWRTSSPRP